MLLPLKFYKKMHNIKPDRSNFLPRSIGVGVGLQGNLGFERLFGCPQEFRNGPFDDLGV